MLDTTSLIEDLERLRAAPNLYVQPVTPEAVFRHLFSVAHGVMLTTDTLDSDDFINARRNAHRVRGWEDRATGPHREMLEKGMTDEEIIDELVDVERQMWDILTKWQESKLKESS